MGCKNLRNGKFFEILNGYNNIINLPEYIPEMPDLISKEHLEKYSEQTEIYQKIEDLTKIIKNYTKVEQEAIRRHNQEINNCFCEDEDGNLPCYKRGCKIREKTEDGYCINVYHQPPPTLLQKIWGHRNSLIEVATHAQNDKKKLIPKLIPDFTPHRPVEYYSTAIEEHYNIKKIRTKWMINISPEWPKSMKGKEIPVNLVNTLNDLIIDWLSIDRNFQHAYYTIENGKNGDHLHAHIVALPSANREKIVNGKLAKHNKDQLIRVWNNHFGVNGPFKGGISNKNKRFSVQYKKLNNIEFIKDKEDYLMEHLKPESHKNNLVLLPQGCCYRREWGTL
jgi:hypothetical protein